MSEVARKHGATRWQIYDWRRGFDSGACCGRARHCSRHSHRWSWKARWRSVTFRRSA
ncbi:MULTISPECIES: hypothetical protein [Bradyrhizobium]|uniref:hypothetical protein n=1 Tax=Bradyrhizobium TaxID=374 RepID=UPI001FDF45FA|nr:MULTISPECIES: hypothetical protein [Bradyrhizobium]